MAKPNEPPSTRNTDTEITKPTSVAAPGLPNVPTATPVVITPAPQPGQNWIPNPEARAAELTSTPPLPTPVPASLAGGVGTSKALPGDLPTAPGAVTDASLDAAIEGAEDRAGRPYLMVKSRDARGFSRAGMRFTDKPTFIERASIGRDVEARLVAEPMLETTKLTYDQAGELAHERDTAPPTSSDNRTAGELRVLLTAAEQRCRELEAQLDAMKADIDRGATQVPQHAAHGFSDMQRRHEQRTAPRMLDDDNDPTREKRTRR